MSIDDMLQRHFAVVGTTVSASRPQCRSSCASRSRRAGPARADPRPAQRVRRRLPDKAYRIDTTTLDLPFWLFRLEEFVEVIFRGREAPDEEVDVLREIIVQAKSGYRAAASGTVLRRQ